MASTQTVWGIDLGRCALKAIKLRATDGKVELVAFDYIEHAKILSQPDADRHELISNALEKFLSRNDLSKDTVVVSVPGQHTLARFTKLPPVVAKRIPDIVRYEADQQIPFDMDEVIWDYQTFQQEDMPDLEVGIFAMKRELIREHLLHFEQASIEPVAVQSSPLAVYAAAHFDGMLEEKGKTILLDIGAENTDLIIATADGFWTRTVPIGGNNFTEALVKSFKLSFSKGEALKRTADSSKYARQIFQAMRPIFADLVQELQRSIGFYSSTHRDTVVEKVVCVGNAFKLPGLQKYLQQNLGLPVERPESFKQLGTAGPAGEGEFKEQILGFAVAYGLALQGLDLSVVTCNLLPTEIAKQVVWRKKKPAFAAAAACVLICGGLIWFRQSSDLGVLAASAASVPTRIQEVEDASRVIDSGPSSSLSGRAQAQAVVDAGNFLKSELRSKSGQGEAERADTEELIDLLHQKRIVPTIFQTIHESVPRPSGALGEAATPAEVLEAITGGAPPRGERDQVFIDKLLMRFDPNLNAIEWETLVVVEEPINDPELDLAGMKIEISCRTPNKGGARYISGSFMNALRENGRKPGRGFYFDRVYLYDGSKVETRGKGSTTSAPAFRSPIGGRGRGFSPGGGKSLTPAAAQPAANVFSGDLDPVTNESIENDWKFEIWIDAILEDYPESDEADSDND